MVPEEDVVALVMEGDDPPAFEVWIVGKEAGQHSGYRVTQSGGEVVQDHFRVVGGWFTMTLCACVCVCKDE